MDPLSITTAALSLLGTSIALSKQISAFVIATKDARKDMDAVSRELASLQLCLESLKEEGDANHFPQKLRESLIFIMRNCQDIVDQLGSLLARFASGNIGRRLQWSLTGRDEAERLRNSLEAHKSAIEIALTVSAVTIGNQVYTDTQLIQVNTNTIPDIKQDTSQIGDLRTEIMALRFQVMQLGQPQNTNDNSIERFLDESIAYAESVVEIRSTMKSELLQDPSESFNHVALTQSDPSSDTASLVSDPFASTMSGRSAPSIFSTATSLSEYWEPLMDVTTQHPNAIKLNRHAVEAAHRTRKRFPKWKKDELDQLLSEAITYQGSDRYSTEQVLKVKSLLDLGAKVKHDVPYSDALSSYGHLAQEVHFGARPEIMVYLFSRGARVNTPDHIVQSSVLLQEYPSEILELLINQGIGPNAFLADTLMSLNMKALRVLLSRNVDVTSALSSAYADGWLGGIQLIAELSQSDFQRLRMSGTSGLPHIVPHIVSGLRYRALPIEMSQKFVSRYNKLTSSKPETAKEACIIDRYKEEVRTQFPELFEPRPPQVKVKGRNWGLVMGDVTGDEKRWKNLADGKNPVKPLTNSAHFAKLSRLMLGQMESMADAENIAHERRDERFYTPHDNRGQGYGDGSKLRKSTMHPS